MNKASRKDHMPLTCTALPLLLLFCGLFMGGCGREVCDFCGENKFCKEFDILGVTRFICQDCLNNPAIAVSGNMVRTYSEMYENGTLEYPEGSPLRPDSGTPTPTAEASAALPTLIPDIHVSNPEDPTPASGDTTPAAATPTSAPASDALNGQALIDRINESLAADNMVLLAKNESAQEYKLYSGETDLHISFKPTAGTNGKSDSLVIELGENASSSDYVKAVIRSILVYAGSKDYDGLGHDIYNQVIQNGEFRYEGVLYRSAVHTADEIEKGAAVSDFSITP